MKDSTRWMLLILTGFILIFLLGLHMGVMHLQDLFLFFYQPPAGAESIDWSAVADRARDVATFAMYMLFLPLALFHGLYGLWNILIEAFSGRKLERPLGWIITLAGLALYAYGAYTTYLSFMQKTM
jgi:succinate dehydrogenase hydrophobic anchor subunit